MSNTSKPTFSSLRKHKLRTTPSYPLSPPVHLPPAPRALLPSQPIEQLPRPRKRYRKKVSGLFAEHKELKKRMSKLLLPVDINKLLDAPLSFDRPKPPKPPPPKPLIEPPKEVIEMLTANAPKLPADAFDFPEYEAIAERIWGPEKYQSLRKLVGNMCPESNHSFLEHLSIAIPESPPPASIIDTPPDRPDVTGCVAVEKCPVSVGRTAVPAKLRRNTKRSEKGYRWEDVRRDRLKAARTIKKKTSVKATNLGNIISDPFRMLVEAATTHQENGMREKREKREKKEKKRALQQYNVNTGVDSKKRRRNFWVIFTFGHTSWAIF